MKAISGWRWSRSKEQERKKAVEEARTGFAPRSESKSHSRFRVKSHQSESLGGFAPNPRCDFRKVASSSLLFPHFLQSFPVPNRGSSLMEREIYFRLSVCGPWKPFTHKTSFFVTSSVSRDNSGTPTTWSASLRSWKSREKSDVEILMIAFGRIVCLRWNVFV